MRRVVMMVLVCGAMINLATGVAIAGPITWTDWTAHVQGAAGTAVGNLPGVTVSYAGEVAAPTQTVGGINYWTQPGPSPYTSATVDNAPPCCDVISLIAGPSSLTFSTPLINPIMAIVSMGQPNDYFVNYTFDQPFQILSFGPGYWGGPGTLTQVGNVLTGEEGHGTIQFLGSISSINWTTSPSENWHGFQIGIAADNVPDGGSALALLGLGMIGLSTLRRKLSK